MGREPRTRLLVALLAAGAAAPLVADPAHVAGVKLVRRPYARYELFLRLEHEDQDQGHFVDRVDALDQDGKRVFFAQFYRPKPGDVEEDGPMRRRFRDVPIPEGAVKLRFRAHCKLTGWGGKELEVDLSRRTGAGYRLETRENRYLPDFEGLDQSPKLRTWRKRLLRDPVPWPFPPDGPIAPVPPDPIDSRPQAKDRQAIVRWPPESQVAF